MAAASSCRPRFTSAMPHFFKIILAQNLTQGKLDVPKKFVRKHEEALRAEGVRLRVPSGDEWRVSLKKNNQKVWFEKGWQEFVSFYSIEIGHFLTFRYEGNFCFHVTIFDCSCTEIKYPLHYSFGQFDKKNVFDGEIRGSQMPNAKREREEFEDGDNGMKKKKPIFRSHESKKEFEDKNKRRMKDKITQTCAKKVIKKLPKKEQDLQAKSVTEKAVAFTSTTMNPCFMVTMGSSYIHTGKGFLNIPSCFANNHLTKEIKESILQISNGRVWKVLCGVRMSDHNLKKFEMKSGWKEFSRDNHLEEGDICVFELMKNTPLLFLFQVTIFRLSSSKEINS